jgi:hypothetical protein
MLRFIIDDSLTEEGSVTLQLSYIILKRSFYPSTIFFGIIGAIWLISLGLWWVVLICVGIIFVSSLFLELLLNLTFNGFHEYYRESREYYIESIDKGKFPFIKPFIRILLFNFFIAHAVYRIFDIILRPYLINSHPLLPLLLIAYSTTTMPFCLCLGHNFDRITLLEISLKDLNDELFKQFAQLLLQNKNITVEIIKNREIRKKRWAIKRIENSLDDLAVRKYFLTRSFMGAQGYILFLIMFFILKKPEELSFFFSLIYIIIFIIVPYYQLKRLINVIEISLKKSINEIKIRYKCSNCGYINDIGAKFCSRCGKDLDAPSTSSL